MIGACMAQGKKEEAEEYKRQVDFPLSIEEDTILYAKFIKANLPASNIGYNNVSDEYYVSGVLSDQTIERLVIPDAYDDGVHGAKPVTYIRSVNNVVALLTNNSTIKSLYVGNNISNDDSQTILEKAKNFDQIVVAMSNVKTSNYTRTINFVNKLAKMDKEVIVIALDTPYDLMSYSSDVKTSVCVYGYQRATTYALSKYLNGEFETYEEFFEELFKEERHFAKRQQKRDAILHPFV